MLDIKIIKTLPFLIFAVSVCSYSSAQDIKKENDIEVGGSEGSQNILDEDEYIGNLVFVTRANEVGFSEKFQSQYRVSTLKEEYYCLENKLSVSLISTYSGNVRQDVNLSIKLNNESMEQYIPSKLSGNLHKYEEFNFSFACEDEAIWAKAAGQFYDTSDYAVPSFIFSFFAVPSDRNLQKIFTE